VVAIVDAQHFKRELAKLKGTAQPAQPWISGKRETGQSWVKRQPAAYQRKLLGPTRYAALQAGQQVIAADGTLIPVHSILGVAAPARTLGAAVPATNVIRAARAQQVRPFPKVAGARR
jgi:hypothetical protein